MTSPVEHVIRRIDRWQQRTTPVAVIFAVIRKFGDDRASMLAALVTFYGFLSLFPLLLLGFTILSFVTPPGSTAYNDLRHSALSHFPVVGNQLPGAGLHRAGLGLAVGMLGLLWGSLGVAQTVQFAINEAWGVPNRDRPNFVRRLLRSVVFVLLLASFLVVTQGFAAAGALFGGSNVVAAAGFVLGVGASAALFLGVFKTLGPAMLRWRDHLPGALLAGVTWQGLQVAARELVAHDVRTMAPVYGQFAVVLGLLAFLSLAAQVTMYSIEVNTVWRARLWPRSLVQPPLTDADRRWLEGRAREEERRREQHVHVSWDAH